MIQKIFLACMACMFTGIVHAEDTAKRLIQEMTGKIQGYTSYEVTFTASMPGEFSDVAGHIIVSGDKYYVATQDYEIFCDGKQFYTYNIKDREITLENVRTEDNSLLSNPSRFFRMNDEDFHLLYRGSASIEGKKIEQVELTPKNKNAEYRSIILQINPQTALPEAVNYQADGMPDVKIEIRKITPNVVVNANMFVPDRKKTKDVEIIDFR